MSSPTPKVGVAALLCCVALQCGRGNQLVWLAYLGLQPEQSQYRQQRLHIWRLHGEEFRSDLRAANRSAP